MGSLSRKAKVIQSNYPTSLKLLRKSKKETKFYIKILAYGKPCVVGPVHSRPATWKKRKKKRL